MHAIRKIGPVFIALLLIATTGGFSIYRHFCCRLGNSTTSIFLKTTCEQEEALVKASCCRLERTPSCCVDKPVPVTKTVIHKDHCCQTSSQFLKISDSFQPGVEKITLKANAVASVLLIFDFSDDVSVTPYLKLFNTDLPPPDSGRQILVANHQLKIDPSLV